MCTGMEIAMMGVQAGGSLLKGMGGAAMHDINAEIAAGNTELLKIQAQIAAGMGDLAVTRGNYDAHLIRSKGDEVLGAQTAGFASRNLDITSGAPLAIAGFTAAQIEVDAGLVVARAMGERADAITRGANIQGQAAQQAYKAWGSSTASDMAMLSGIFDAGTAFLTGGSKAGVGGGPIAQWPMFSGAGASPIGWDIGNPFLLHQPQDL